MELAMEEDETQKNGLAVIIDMEGYSLKLFRWLTPHNISVGVHKFYVSRTMFGEFRKISN